MPNKIRNKSNRSKNIFPGHCFKYLKNILFFLCRKNGFALEEDPDAVSGQRFKLKAVPFSKNITFGVEGNVCIQTYCKTSLCFLETVTG